MSDNQPENKGEPTSFSPHELRIGGHWVVKVLIIVLVVAVIYMIVSRF